MEFCPGAVLFQCVTAENNQVGSTAGHNGKEKLSGPYMAWVGVWKYLRVNGAHGSVFWMPEPMH